MGNNTSHPGRSPSASLSSTSSPLPPPGASSAAASAAAPATKDLLRYGSPKRTSSRRDPRRLIQRGDSSSRPASAVSATTSTPARPASAGSHAAPAHQDPRPGVPAAESPVPAPAPISQPVDCPPKPPVAPWRNLDDPAYASTSPPQSGAYFDSIHTSSSGQDMSYHLTRPPRMPLPIEEEVHTPGSPIIPPLEPDDAVPILPSGDGDVGYLPRDASNMSNGSVDEDEEYAIDRTKAAVPIVVEWEEGGNKVYVTGTIFQWNKKHRLHPVPDRPGVMRAQINARPGTHHIRFIVDGDMKCSTKMPTTVDFGNNLVNYIEVAARDVDSAAASDPTGQKGQAGAPQPDAAAETGPVGEELARKPKLRNVPSASHYTSQVPQYLDDIEKSEDSTAFQLATAAVQKLPAPPSLPGFLAKPILNAVAPYKDDNSVLTMPNHTQLNHLGTSSFKDEVLAVSVTTRYKRKYVTTIMYMPTS